MCTWLTAEQAREYAQLTTASLALRLDGLAIPKASTAQQSNQLFAAGLTFSGLPAALVMVKTTSAGSLEILSLAVLTPFRRLGLAKQLLIWLRCEASRLGWSSLAVSYPRGHACTEAMASLTHVQYGWQLSEGLRLVHFDRVGGQAVVNKLQPVRMRWRGNGRFHLLPWKDLNQEHTNQILALQQLAPSWAWPMDSNTDDPLGVRDEQISRALLDREQVIGWLIAHRVGLSLFRVTQWWVIPERQGRGFALMLLQQAVADAMASQPPYSAGCFGVHHANNRMVEFSKHHLEAIACNIQCNQRAILLVNESYSSSRAWCE